MSQEIKTYGAQVLRNVSEEVSEITDEIRELLDEMVETMHEVKGVGLAAPQVGVNIRAFVIDIGDGKVRKVINPKIEFSTETEDNEEGCLSVPGIYRNVCRPKTIKVTYLNENGEVVVEEASDLLSRAFQHENDHLDGILFVDKISPVAKRLITKKLQLMEKKAK